MTFSQTYFSGQNLQSYRPDDPSRGRSATSGLLPYFIMIKINGNIVITIFPIEFFFPLNPDGLPVESQKIVMKAKVFMVMQK